MRRHEFLAFCLFGITGVDKGLSPIIGLLSKSGYVRFSRILKNFFLERCEGINILIFWVPTELSLWLAKTSSHPKAHVSPLHCRHLPTFIVRQQVSERISDRSAP